MCYHALITNGSEKLALYGDKTLYFSRKTESVDSTTGTIETVDISGGGKWSVAQNKNVLLELGELTGTMVTVNDDGINDTLHTVEARDITKSEESLGEFKTWSLPDVESDSD